MIYNSFGDKKLSSLGFGTMRLPVIDGKDTVINEEETARMVKYAMEKGINYYDTAWGYHGGNSETVMGKILKDYPRESFYLASKFPGYDLSNMDKVESIFEKQLEKCQVEYFDFYLIHNVCELNINDYLDESHGILPYLRKQRENGRIRHLGFSLHGSMEVMQRFLEVYGPYMEFGQLQINYLDWNFQDSKSKTQLLEKHNIPVWVMEPLRGGKLASISDADAEALKKLRPEEAPLAWAFRFLQSIDSITVTLSGMSSFDQLKQNIEIFEEHKPLNEKEMQAILALADEMVKRIALPCTACRYCLSHCPQELNIPHLLELYNEHHLTGGGFIAPMVIGTLPEDKRPSACIGCKSCEAVCPQQINISGAMEDFAARLKR